MMVDLSTFNFGKFFERSILTSTFRWLLFGCIGAFSSHAFAQEREWWFDIEVIVYKQNIAPNAISEAFPERLNHYQPQQWADPISAYLYPDLTALYLTFPVCFAAPLPEPPLAVFEVDMDIPEFQPVDLKLSLKNPDADSHLADSISELVVTEAQNTQDPMVSLRTFDDGSYFSPTHLALWADKFSLTQPRIPQHSLCRYEEQQAPTPYIENIPKLVQYKEIKDSRNTQLLSSESLELSDLAKSIQRKRGLTTLLHMGWRQQVFFGNENATPMRIIAGENFAREFGKDGLTRPLLADTIETDELDAQSNSDDSVLMEYQYDAKVSDNEAMGTVLQKIDGNIDVPKAIEFDLVTQIKQALNDKNFVYMPSSEEQAATPLTLETPEALWELDGSINVFLRYIQRTPYLHIDTDLDIRAPLFEEDVDANQKNTNEQGVLPSRLQSYPLKQMRRVISKQLHYFDHPMFGVVVQIRRFSFPEPPVGTEQE